MSLNLFPTAWVLLHSLTAGAPSPAEDGGTLPEDHWNDVREPEASVSDPEATGIDSEPPAEGVEGSGVESSENQNGFTADDEPPDPLADTVGEDVEPGPEAVAPPVATGTTPALDLCTLAPGDASDQYQRQRVVVFAPSIDPGLLAPIPEYNEKGEKTGRFLTTLSQIASEDIVTQALHRTLPMQRLYAVISPDLSPSQLATRQQIAVADAQGMVADSPFTAYSLGCADWIAIPEIQRTRARWDFETRTRTVKGKSIPYRARDIDIGISVSLTVFRRGEFGFEKVEGVSGGTSASGGFLAGSSMLDASAYNEFVSPWPEPGCELGTAVDGQEGSVRFCPASPIQYGSRRPRTAVGSKVRCGGVSDAADAGLEAERALARCELYRATQSATNVVQKNAKNAYWSLYARLRQVGDQLGFSLGKADDVRRGDYYFAETDEGERLGFAHIVKLGEGGGGTPSILKFRSGSAPLGSMMTELAMIGLHVAIHPTFVVLFDRGDLSTRVAGGGGVDVAWSLSRWIPGMDESWVRFNLGYAHGADSEGFLDFDLGFEATWFVGRGVAAGAGAGFSALFVSAPYVDDRRQSATSAGAFLRGLVDWAWHPAWALRFALDLRAGSRADLRSRDPVLGWFDTGASGGTLTSMTTRLSIGHTF